MSTADVIDRVDVTRHYSRKFSWFNRCVYCGCTATDLDHVFPVAAARNLNLAHPRIKKHLWRVLYLVPACRDCNSIAGSKVFKTIIHKRQYIQDRLREKHKKVLRARIWDQDDLRGVKGRLRQEIIRTMKNRLILEHRTSYPNFRTAVPLCFLD